MDRCVSVCAGEPKLVQQCLWWVTHVCLLWCHTVMIRWPHDPELLAVYLQCLCECCEDAAVCLDGDHIDLSLSRLKKHKTLLCVWRLKTQTYDCQPLLSDIISLTEVSCDAAEVGAHPWIIWEQTSNNRVCVWVGGCYICILYVLVYLLKTNQTCHLPWIRICTSVCIYVC